MSAATSHRTCTRKARADNRSGGWSGELSGGLSAEFCLKARGGLRGLIASLMCPVSARASKEDLGPYSSSRGTDWRLKSGDGELAGGDCLAPRLPLVHSCGHARPIASHATVRISLRHRCRHARPIASHATPRASLRRRCRRARPIASHATL